MPPTLAAANATTLAISIEFGFDPTAAHNTVVFSDEARSATVTAATATSLTVTFSDQANRRGHRSTPLVTTDSCCSEVGTAVQMATVSPVVTSNTATLAANATTLTISGTGFDSTASHNTVVFNDGAIGTVAVSAATATSLDRDARRPTRRP